MNEPLLWFKQKLCFHQGDPGEKGSQGLIGYKGVQGPAGPKVSLFFQGNPSLCTLYKNLWDIFNVQISQMSDALRQHKNKNRKSRSNSIICPVCPEWNKSPKEKNNR